MEISGRYDVIVIGGGPAGMAAAIAAYEESRGRVAIIERNSSLGGILPQCLHNGFGAVNFDRDYPGPQYAHKYEKILRSYDIDVLLDTTVLEITPEKEVYAVGGERGYLRLAAKAIVLAMGCRERTRAQIGLPGSRAAGIYTAGAAQRLVNVEGYLPGKNVVILGSGDIGMIMARRLTIEGAKVLSVLELQPFLTGLRRNYVQCLKDYDIPLRLSTTVKRIIGKSRVEAIESVRVDENLRPIEGSEELIPCDTLVLSVGLIPENELSRKLGLRLDSATGGPYLDSNLMTSIPGIFAAGNVSFVYDLVDYVSKAGETAGRNAANYAGGGTPDSATVIDLKLGSNVGSIVPQQLKVDQASLSGAIITLRPKVLLDRPVKIEFSSAQGPVLSFREQYARPAEMMVFKMRERDIAQLTALGRAELSVAIG